ncbi:hypothetical protein PY793_01860 [Acetobacter fabarum]|uniref:hypothetical protein n=1 Tax=Acetobacter fabarum TaxID=483199 RepID=UPI00312B6486
MPEAVLFTSVVEFDESEAEPFVIFVSVINDPEAVIVAPFPLIIFELFIVLPTMLIFEALLFRDVSLISFFFKFIVAEALFITIALDKILVSAVRVAPVLPIVKPVALLAVKYRVLPDSFVITALLAVLFSTSILPPLLLTITALFAILFINFILDASLFMDAPTALFPIKFMPLPY